MVEYIITLWPSMLSGLETTLKMFSLTLIFSIPLGILVAVGRLSKIKPISLATQFYIWVMRGTPLLLQIVFVFFGLPIIGITFDRFPAALLAFVLNYAAYFGEIFRAGIETIDSGQYDGAKVLGFSPAQTFTRIILPQMTKNVLPPVANEVITLVKDTALVYVVGLGELLRAGKNATNRDATLVPLVMVGVIYLLLTAVLTLVFKKLEDRYSYYE